MSNLELLDAESAGQDASAEEEEETRPGGLRFSSADQRTTRYPIDLNRVLQPHPASTFFARVAGTAMRDADLDVGDLLVVDKSLEPRSGRVAVCIVDDEFVVRSLEMRKDGITLHAAHPGYPPLHLSGDEMQARHFEVWGVVTYVIKHVGK